MKTLALVLLSAPIGYLVLTGYLVSKVKPAPLTFVPRSGARDDKPLEAVAA